VQALIWEAPEVMRVGDVPDPRPEPGWAVVRVAAVGICGSELGAYLGHNELRVPPLVMGHEWGGVVDAVGSGEDRAWVGRTVTVNPLLSCGHCRACRRGERQLCIERRIIGIDYPGAFAERVAVPVVQEEPDQFRSGGTVLLVDDEEAVRNVAVLMLGALGDEYLLMGQTAVGRGLPQVVGATAAETLPFVVATANAPILGEEVFASGAYLSERPVYRASLLAQDWLRELILAIIVGLVLLQTFRPG